MGRKQMIAIDGSDQAQHAFDWYLENFNREGDLVILTHCAEYSINMGMPGTHNIEFINGICESIKKREDEISNLTDGFLNVLRQRKIESKVLILNGKPGESIISASKLEGVDHIIMGTRGLGTLRRTLLGSVSEYVVHHADCPVTICRKPQE